MKTQLGLTCAVLVAVAGCSAVVNPSDAAVDGAADAPHDGALDATDGGCATPMPSEPCLSGVAGGSCGDVAVSQVCVAGAWGCPPGTVPASQCRCSGPRPPGACTCTASGWSCPDAGTDAGCPGTPPPNDCVSGVPGGACGDAILQRVCSGGSWVCPAGTIPVSQCRCIGRPPGACTCTASGWSCPDAGGCSECVGALVTWGLDGGLVAFSDQSQVAPCRTFTFTRVSHGGPPDRTCSNELPGCTLPDMNTVGDLNAVLADPDVVRALAAAPVLYGRDTRPVDGSVFRIEVGGRRIEIGAPCAPGAPACVPVPAGVARAQSFLQALTTERLRIGSCAMVFPSG